MEGTRSRAHWAASVFLSTRFLLERDRRTFYASISPYRSLKRDWAARVVCWALLGEERRQINCPVDPQRLLRQVLVRE